MYENIVTLITTVGFPIACCIFMGVFIYQNNTRYMNEVKDMRDCINRNTEALESLIEHLKGGIK